MQRTLQCQVPLAPCNLSAPSVGRCHPFRQQQRQRTSRHRCIVKAELETQALLAVTQQGLFFGDSGLAAAAAFAAGEAYLSRQALAPDAPGRPAIAPTAAAVGGVVGAVAITQIGGLGTQVGLVAGLGVTLTLLVNYGKRFADTKDDPYDWPGPKVWPFTMVVLTFFAVNIFGQGLVQSF